MTLLHLSERAIVEIDSEKDTLMTLNIYKANQETTEGDSQSECPS